MNTPCFTRQARARPTLPAPPTPSGEATTTPCHDTVVPNLRFGVDATTAAPTTSAPRLAQHPRGLPQGRARRHHVVDEQDAMAGHRHAAPGMRRAGCDPAHPASAASATACGASRREHPARTEPGARHQQPHRVVTRGAGMPRACPGPRRPAIAVGPARPCDRRDAPRRRAPARVPAPHPPAVCALSASITARATPSYSSPDQTRSPSPQQPRRITSGTSARRQASHSARSSAPHPAHSTGSSTASASSTASRSQPTHPVEHAARADAAKRGRTATCAEPLLLRREEGGVEPGVLPAGAAARPQHVALVIEHPGAFEPLPPTIATPPLERAEAACAARRWRRCRPT